MRTSVSLIALCAAGALGLFPQAMAADNTAKPIATQAPAVPDPASLAKSLDSELQRAHALRVQGNYVESTHVLSQLMLADPDDARVVGEYGKALAQEGQSKDAIAFLKRAVELQPGDWSLYSALGVAYDQADDAKSAQAAYERALLLKPGDPVVLNNYAVSRILAGDLSGAEKLLVQARAAGAALPKIASNAELLSQIKETKGPTASPNMAAPPAMRNSAPVAAVGGVTTAAARPDNTNRTVAGESPSTSVKGLPRQNVGLAAAPGSNAAIAPSQPAKTAGTVVMQRVPVDPQAGPVAHATTPPRTVANASNAKMQKKTSPPPAALRTADQGE